MIKAKILEIASGILVNIFCRGRLHLFASLSKNSYSGAPTLFQPLHCEGAGRINFGAGVKIGVSPSPYLHSTYAYLDARREGTLIEIGDGTWINNNFCAIADHTKIIIGKGCFIGANVTIFDSDFHGLRTDERTLSKPEWASPVVIGDNVFIGFDVKILKGVTIGDGAAIGNGSIVTRDVPPAMIAAGVPAKVIKHANA